ncbi:hypothetical protein ACGFIW_01725 [Micromonospora sp. NPDC048935]|uniref:phage tail tube protein n=1 Tax=Micromonospora sp. NPDC048935 TaxID=3364262 RepID=UPI003720A277
MTMPNSVPADGNQAVWWVPALADPENPTVAELTAPSVIDASCYLTAEGWTPETDEQTVTDERLCSTSTYEQPGRLQHSLNVSYVHNPDSPADNELYLALTRLTTGYWVARIGVPYDQAVTAGDIVDVYPAKMGWRRKQPGTANSVLTVTQKPFITGPVVQDAVVVA